MGQIGGIKPGFHQGYQAHMWLLPVSVYNEDTDETYTVTAIFEDEGFLLINVKGQPQPPEEGV